MVGVERRNCRERWNSLFLPTPPRFMPQKPVRMELCRGVIGWVWGWSLLESWGHSGSGARSSSAVWGGTEVIFAAGGCGLWWCPDMAVTSAVLVTGAMSRDWEHAGGFRVCLPIRMREIMRFSICVEGPWLERYKEAQWLGFNCRKSCILKITTELFEKWDISSLWSSYDNSEIAQENCWRGWYIQVTTGITDDFFS